MDVGDSQPHINSMLTEAQEAPWSACAAATTTTGGVGVTRLALTNFRNYREARLVLDTGPIVLTGPNGAGKTNLLEAVSFLAPGRGLRGSKLTEIDWRPAGQGLPAALTQGWAVAATVVARGGEIRIGTGRDPAEGDRRIVRING